MPYADRPNTILWPPIIYVAALVLPSPLQDQVPLPTIDFGVTIDNALVLAGMALIVIGLSVDVWALMTFRTAGTPFNPTKRAENLATFGPYARTRNPMYLGALVAYLGLALGAGNLWRWIALPLMALGLHQLAVLREEAHLEARFGEAWREYAGRVPRWW